MSNSMSVAGLEIEHDERTPTIHVVDPDVRTQQMISQLSTTMQLHCRQYATGQGFLAQANLTAPGCLITEVRIRDMSGFQLQEQIAERRGTLPVIFLTAYGDIAMSVRALKAGASDFLEKPSREQELWEAIGEAVRVQRERSLLRQKRAEFDLRVGSLSEGERQVLEHLVGGRSKQEISRELDICIRTVEIRRANILKKIEARSVVDLVRMALEARYAGVVARL